MQCTIYVYCLLYFKKQLIQNFQVMMWYVKQSNYTTLLSNLLLANMSCICLRSSLSFSFSLSHRKYISLSLSRNIWLSLLTCLLKPIKAKNIRIYFSYLHYHIIFAQIPGEWLKNLQRQTETYRLLYLWFKFYFNEFIFTFT